jgi:hypothetical protein
MFVIYIVPLDIPIAKHKINFYHLQFSSIQVWRFLNNIAELFSIILIMTNIQPLNYIKLNYFVK